jgi:hypothetical protein
MGIAIMGGFTTSTLLTLVVVPVLFTYVDTFQRRIIKLMQGGRKKTRHVAVENEVRSPISEAESLPPDSIEQPQPKFPLRK